MVSVVLEPIHQCQDLSNLATLVNPTCDMRKTAGSREHSSRHRIRRNSNYTELDRDIESGHCIKYANGFRDKRLYSACSQSSRASFGSLSSGGDRLLFQPGAEA